MKNLYLILIFTSILFVQDLMAQVPQGFNYQAVARDLNDKIIKDDFVSLRLWLLEDNSAGTPVYREVHQSIYTGLNGVITLVVGQGNAEVGDFSSIDWGTKEYFLRVDLDPDGGTNYSQMGSTQLLTVPYAMFALQSGNGGGGTNDNWGTQTVQHDNSLTGAGTSSDPLRVDVSQVNTDSQILSINGDQLSIDDGNTITLPTDGDGDSNNEIQTLSINGNSLSISDGNSISIPTGGTDADADPSNELQNLDAVWIGPNNNDLELSISDGTGVIFSIEDGDSDNANELQTLSINGNSLTISDGNSISIPTGGTDADADPNNEIQDLSNSKNGADVTLDISQGFGTTFSVEDDDANASNELQDLNFTWSGTNQNDANISISNGTGVAFSVDDGDSDGTNEIQTLSINGNSLSISDGNSISIPTGGTDADADPSNEIQDLSNSTNGTNVTLDITQGSGTTFSIEDEDSDDGNELQDLVVSSSGTDVDIDISDGVGVTFSIEDEDSDDENELQNLDMNVTGNGDIQIDISDGSSSVFFSVEDDDSDSSNELQSLSVSGNNLSLSNGNTITFPNTSLWDLNPQFLGIHFDNEVSIGTDQVFGELNVNGRGVFLNPNNPDPRSTIFPDGRIELNGDNGPKARLSTIDRGNLELFDSNGQKKVEIETDDEEGSIKTFNDIGFPVAEMTSNDDGSGIIGTGSVDERSINCLMTSLPGFENNGLIEVKDIGNISQATMFVNSNGKGELNAGTLELFNSNGAMVVDIDTDGSSDSGIIEINNAFGSEIIEIGANNTGTGTIRTKSSDEQSTNCLITHLNGSENNGFMGVLDINNNEQASMFVNSSGLGEFNGDRMQLFNNSGSRTILLDRNSAGGSFIGLTNQFGQNQTVRLLTRSDNGVGQIELYGASNLNVVLGHSASDERFGGISVFDDQEVGQAGFFINSSGQGEVWGDIKNFKMDYPGKADKTIWYASVEGPEAGAYERGTATLENGEIFVPFSDHFQHVIVEKGMTVMLTPLSGASQGLAVVEKTKEGFKVIELHKGTGNYSFDWEVKGVRAGFENYQVIRSKSYGEITQPIQENR